MESEGTREKRRSERVRLGVPVIVTTETLEGEEVQEVTHTVTVNAHGGLFKLKMEVLVGQPMILTNMESKSAQLCRVVRVERLPGAEFGVAFEFHQPSPQFWPLAFPPADWNAASS